MDKVYKALSDKNRREILEVLKKKDMAVNEIAQNFSFSGATLSHHLTVLKNARLVVSQRQGQNILYSLNTSVFEEALKKIINLFQKS